MPMTLKELAQACEARIEGGDPAAVIEAAADIRSALAGQVTQLTHSRYTKYLNGSAATACFVGEGSALGDVPATMALLVCADPEMGFVKAMALLYPERAYPSTIAPQAVLAADVSVGAGVHIAPYAVLGEHAVIGDNTAILAGAYIGNKVTIGKHCRIHPYAVIYDDVVIGDYVIIHAGAVIGADGFGYKFRDHQHIKVPQVGNVVIGDKVEIGANTCIDRGTLGSTTLGQGSKIDNLVQIGHNNKIGRHVIMCGQTGVSGSCQIDDYAILAGGAGIADHVNIGQGAVVMGRSGVTGDVPTQTQVFGTPAKDKRVAYKEQIALSKLPELLKKVKLLEEQLQNLTNLKNQSEI